MDSRKIRIITCFINWPSGKFKLLGEIAVTGLQQKTEKHLQPLSQSSLLTVFPWQRHRWTQWPQSSPDSLHLHHKTRAKRSRTHTHTHTPDSQGHIGQHRHLRWIEEDDSRTFHWHLHACQATLNIKTCLCPLPYSKNTRRFLNYSFN